MKLQHLLSLTRKAVDDYEMIRDGDKIAVGISGGKDSLTLLKALAELRRFYPHKYELTAISVNLGYDIDYRKTEEFCKEAGVELTIEKTEIADIIFNIRKEPNPCSLCAKLRKGAFNDTAIRLGCNKIAYAHHRDDAIETFLMSLIYEGRVHSFSPVTYLDRKNVTLIRPLLYVNECDIVGFKNLYDLPVFRNPCPADGETKREDVKQLIRHLNDEAPGIRDRLFRAMVDSLPSWKIKSDQL